MRLLLTICNYLVNILGHRILRVIQNKDITRKIRERKNLNTHLLYMFFPQHNYFFHLFDDILIL